MNDEHYQELLSRLLEGELSEAEAEDLARDLRARPELLRDLRRHLVLWEAWAQLQAPERSAEAFMAAWRTRLRAESDQFVERLKKRVSTQRFKQAPQAKVLLARRRWRPARLGIGAMLALLAGVALWLVWPSFRAPRRLPARVEATLPRNQLVTVAGDGICTRCVLHQSDDHQPALRIVEGGAAKTIYVELNNVAKKLQGRFCAGPTRMVARGILQDREGRVILAVKSLELVK